MATYTWTDLLGRSYKYEPYRAVPIADLEIATAEATTFAIAEASRALGTGPPLPEAGIAAVLYRSESSASSIIENIMVGPRRILEAEVAHRDEIRCPQPQHGSQNQTPTASGSAADTPPGQQETIRSPTLHRSYRALPQHAYRRGYRPHRTLQIPLTSSPLSLAYRRRGGTRHRNGGPRPTELPLTARPDPHRPSGACNTTHIIAHHDIPSQSFFVLRSEVTPR